MGFKERVEEKRIISEYIEEGIDEKWDEETKDTYLKGWSFIATEIAGWDMYSPEVKVEKAKKLAVKYREKFEKGLQKKAEKERKREERKRKQEKKENEEGIMEKIKIKIKGFAKNVIRLFSNIVSKIKKIGKKNTPAITSRAGGETKEEPSMRERLKDFANQPVDKANGYTRDNNLKIGEKIVEKDGWEQD